LTGEDYLRAEEKGKKAFSFKYDGMVVVSSNFPIFVGDNSSGLARRLLLVPFSQRPSQRKNLTQEFQGELASFTNYLLSLDEDFVTRTLLGLDPVPEITLQAWEQRIRTDSIASWLNDCVIFDAIATTSIGCDRTEGLSGDTPTTLYGSYALHCHRSGTTPKANKNFSPDLLELCNHILSMPIEKCHTKVGKQIKGIRLRTAQDFDIPTLDFQMVQSVMDSVMGMVTGHNLDAVTLSSIGDGLITSPCEKEISLDVPLPPLENVKENPPPSICQGDEALPVTILQTQSNQPSDSSPHPSPDPSPDFSSFPHRTSDDIRAKENHAVKCRELMLGCSNSEELALFKRESGFSENEIKWVYNHLLSPSEKEAVRQAAIAHQLTLPVTENPDLFENGDLVYYLDNRTTIYTYIGYNPYTGSALIRDSQGRSCSCHPSQLSKIS
jgi:putative DNA primase/helicase